MTSIHFQTDASPLSKMYTAFNYRKIPKYSDSRKIAEIILKFEQCGSIIE